MADFQVSMITASQHHATGKLILYAKNFHGSTRQLPKVYSDRMNSVKMHIDPTDIHSLIHKYYIHIDNIIALEFMIKM